MPFRTSLVSIRATMFNRIRRNLVGPLIRYLSNIVETIDWRLSSRESFKSDQLRLPLFVSPPLRSLHGRPGCSRSIDLPYAYHHGDASLTSPSASLRPKHAGITSGCRPSEMKITSQYHMLKKPPYILILTCTAASPQSR